MLAALLWCAVLCRQLLLALISKHGELLRVGAVLNKRFMQPDAAVAADEFMLITAARRYGFIKRVVHKKLRSHMTAVRKHMASATAGQKNMLSKSESDAETRPAKKQRCMSETLAGAAIEPAAAAAAGGQRGGRPGKASAASGSTGSDGSGSGSCNSSLTQVGAAVVDATAAVAGRQSDNSSGGSSLQQGSGDSRRSMRERGSGAAVFDDELVGRSIQVWWPLDSTYYLATVTLSELGAATK
jgi:hypothetical protein